MKLKFLFVFLVFASVFAATRADEDVAAPIEDNGNCHRGIGAFFHHGPLQYWTVTFYFILVE